MNKTKEEETREKQTEDKIEKDKGRIGSQIICKNGKIEEKISRKHKAVGQTKEKVSKEEKKEDKARDNA